MAEDTSTPKMAGDGSMPIERSAPWAVNFRSADFIGGSLNVELKAAPTRDNSAHYITHITMGTVASAEYTIICDCNLTIVDGGGSNAFGPVQFCNDGQTTFSKDFSNPLKITDGRAIDLTGVASSGYQPSCFVFIEGFTGDKPLG